MRIEDINRIALLKGISLYHKSKSQIIHEIQIKEGYEPCYGTNKFTCKYTNCLWWKDCQGMFHKIEVI